MTLKDDAKKRQAVADRLRKHGTDVPGDDAPTRIEVSSMLAARTKRGAVELVLGPTRVQCDIAKAKELHGMLGEAIEAAISDELMFAFLTQKVGLPEAQAAAALLELRELRQGSKDTVYPQ